MRAERGGEHAAQFGPAGDVVLVRQGGGVQPEPGQHGGVELRLDGADGDVATVGALVGVVVGRAAVEHVGAALVGPHPGSAHLPHHLDQHAGAVDHRRIDDLSLAGSLPLPQRRQDADQQEHRAATEVTDQVQRRDRPLVHPADGVQDAVEGDVVDVVAGLLAARAGLAPPGHPAVDQSLVDLCAVIGTQAEPLGDAGPEALDQHVGLGDELEHRVAAFGGLEVGGDDAPVAAHGVFHHAAGTV